ncbi:MAG TPA: cysteine hydrolase [Rhodopila sp.]|jgi:ureidoacrylate peracid hydrolase
MHTIDIPQIILDRVALNRPQRHIFTTLDPSRTAHVVVDLQNGFMDQGAPVEVPTAREIVPNVNRITKAVREGGGTIVYLRFMTDAGALKSWSAFYDAMFSPSRREAMVEAFGPDCYHFALSPQLDVQPSDWIVDKTRFSGFVPGACDLDERLRAAGIDTLIITGTLTNCCCESTARDAMQRDYRVIFVSDGNAALTDAEHNATLANMVTLFADVMTTDEVVACAAAMPEHATKAA